MKIAFLSIPQTQLGSLRLWCSKSRLVPTCPVGTPTLKLIDSTVHIRDKCFVLTLHTQHHSSRGVSRLICLTVACFVTLHVLFLDPCAVQEWNNWRNYNLINLSVILFMIEFIIWIHAVKPHIVIGADHLVACRFFPSKLNKNTRLGFKNICSVPL